MAEAPTTRKVQLSVPIADTTVIEWLDLQYSASESVRRLIRESVAREGFVDVANRPVRPPAHPVHVAEDFPADIDDVPDESEAPAAPAPKASRSAAPKASAPRAPEAEADAETDAPEPPAPTRRAARSDNAEATATIDDLLGL